MRREKNKALFLAGVLTVLSCSGWAGAQCSKVSFSQVINSSALNTIGVLTEGDFNNDSKKDLIVSGPGDFRLSILPGNGDGTFGSSSYILPEAPVGNGNTPEIVAVGDFNNDGNQDMAVSHRVGFSINILLGRGDGTFDPGMTIPVEKGKFDSLTVGDLNSDGNADIIGTMPPDISNLSGFIVIILGEGSGIFSPPVFYNPVPNNGTRRSATRIIGIADINRDSRTDLGLLTSSTGAVTQSVRIVTGSGDGTFNFGNSITTQVPNNTVVNLSDINADGRLDMLIVDSANRRASLRAGRGDGTFGAAMNSSLRGQAGEKLELVDVADFNADGKLDLAIKNIVMSGGATITNSVSVYLGRGNGIFNTVSTLPFGQATYALMAEDFNSDGRTDLAAGNFDSNVISIRLNRSCADQGAKTQVAQKED
jgi:hypothetical protein